MVCTIIVLEWEQWVLGNEWKKWPILLLQKGWLFSFAKKGHAFTKGGDFVVLSIPGKCSHINSVLLQCWDSWVNSGVCVQLLDWNNHAGQGKNDEN